MKLIFQHIPKAGGTTFHAILEKVYQKGVIHDIEVKAGKLTVNEFTELSAHQRNQIDLLKGHMPYGLHNYFSRDKVKYITLFRHPVKRIISHYFYVLRTPVHYLYKEVVGKKMTLQEYALSDLTNELDNGQVRLLVEGNTPLNEMNEKILEKALENLKTQFITFGIVEKFDESLLLFKEKLNWENYPYYRKLNVTKQKPYVADDVKAAIEERNQYDMILYKTARQWFEHELNNIDHLDEELQILRQMNQVYGKGFDEGYNEGYKAPFNQLFVVKAGKSIYKRLKRLKA